jgi:hypothetical protein
MLRLTLPAMRSAHAIHRAMVSVEAIALVPTARTDTIV